MRYLHMLAEAFDATRFNMLIRKLNPKIRKRIPILTYHRVMNMYRDYPFDRELVSATEEDFYQQMQYIASHFQPISMGQYIAHLNGEADAPVNSILVTFDDGFADNYHLAFPILREFEIPATIFVTTDFVESNQPIWYEHLAYFFHRTPLTSFQKPTLSLDLKFDDNQTRQAAYLATVNQLKRIPESMRLEFLAELFRDNGDPFKDANETDQKAALGLTWAQVTELKTGGVDIGSHSVTHPILSNLEPDVLEYEMVESKRVLEEHLQSPVLSIAFPDGQASSFSAKVMRAAEAAGYEVGFSFEDGIAATHQLDRYAIPRLHVELDDPISLLKSKLSLPSVFCE